MGCRWGCGRGGWERSNVAHALHQMHTLYWCCGHWQRLCLLIRQHRSSPAWAEAQWKQMLGIELDAWASGWVDGREVEAGCIAAAFLSSSVQVDALTSCCWCCGWQGPADVSTLVALHSMHREVFNRHGQACDTRLGSFTVKHVRP